MTIVNEKRLIAIASILIAMLITTGVFGATPSDDTETRTMVVSTQGLDLASPAGQALLQQRIETASRKVCGLYESGASSISTSYRECHEAAVADAAAQSRVLVARAEGRTLIADKGR